MKVLELKGYNSLKALNAFHTLLLGLKMLPAYMGESYEDFYSRISELDEIDQEKLIREAALFVQLEKDEIIALTSFCTDANGIPYRAENMNNLSPKELVEIIVAVSMQISRMKIGLVSDKEKKN